MSKKKRIGGLVLVALFPLALFLAWAYWGGPSVEARLQDGVSEEDIAYFRSDPKAIEEVKVLMTEASYSERSEEMGGSVYAYPVVSSAAQVLLKMGRQEDYDALLAELTRQVTTQSFVLVGKPEVIEATDASKVIEYALKKWEIASSEERLALNMWLTMLNRKSIGDETYKRWVDDVWERFEHGEIEETWTKSPFNELSGNVGGPKSIYDPMLLAFFLDDRDWSKEADALFSDDANDRVFGIRFLAGVSQSRDIYSDVVAEKMVQVAEDGVRSDFPEVVEVSEIVLEREKEFVERANQR